MITCKRNNLLSRFNLYFVFLCVLYLGGDINKCLASKISYSINPNCNLTQSECEKPWIVYGKEENETYTVHYLWSAERLPTFLIAYSNPDTDIIINWSNLQNGIPGAISFTKVPENILGISFQTLILFNDIHDTGKLDDITEENKKYASLSDFEWKILPCKNISSSECKFSFNTTSFRGKALPNDTNISFSVTSYDQDGRSDDLPHLLKTPTSAHIEVVLNNLTLTLNDTSNNFEHAKDDEVIPISGFYHPRWALDAIFVSDDKPKDDEKGFAYKSVKSLDDEYTPGVFDLNSITTEGARQSSASADLGGYFQWRPVCYLTSDKDINYSTYPNINKTLPPIDEAHRIKAKESLFYIMFGDNMENLVGLQTPIAFGLSKDKYYTEHNYTEWTFAMGLGPAPTENFSTLIIIIISVAVGVPCVLFIAGGSYLLVKKIRRRGQVPINE